MQGLGVPHSVAEKMAIKQLKHVVHRITDLKPARRTTIPHAPVRSITSKCHINHLLYFTLHIGEDIKRLQKKLFHGLDVSDLVSVTRNCVIDLTNEDSSSDDEEL